MFSYLNPIDFVKRLNWLVVPAMISHLVLCGLFLIHLEVIAFLLAVPVAVWDLKKYLAKKHLLDSTTVITTLPAHRKESYFKLGFYLIFFFFAMFKMIYSLIHVD